MFRQLLFPLEVVAQEEAVEGEVPAHRLFVHQYHHLVYRLLQSLLEEVVEQEEVGEEVVELLRFHLRFPLCRHQKFLPAQPEPEVVEVAGVVLVVKKDHRLLQVGEVVVHH